MVILKHLELFFFLPFLGLWGRTFRDPSTLQAHDKNSCTNKSLKRKRFCRALIFFYFFLCLTCKRFFALLYISTSSKLSLFEMEREKEPSFSFLLISYSYTLTNILIHQSKSSKAFNLPSFKWRIYPNTAYLSVSDWKP